jgi:site-specific recombinase XerD
MSETKKEMTLNLKILGDDSIENWIDEFLLDKKLQNLSKRTITIYGRYLRRFSSFCETAGVAYVKAITPSLIRGFLFYLDQKGHNSGGIHIYYRTLKTFLFWWENEVEPEGYRNPIRKVDGPRLKPEPIEPVSLGDVEKLINTCDLKTFYDLRDKAIMLFLLDTGTRASEACNVNLGDVDLVGGRVLIRKGKGGKSRTVFIGKTTRKAIRMYLRLAHNHHDVLDDDVPLWITSKGKRLRYDPLNLMLRRRAKRAVIPKPGLHDFRRAFALNFLRDGGDIYSLQKLMGHADLQVLRRYLAQNDEDLRIAHHRHSPVDNMMKK